MRSSARRLVRTEEAVAIEVDQMVWLISDPDFSLPSERGDQRGE
jgi:hypothetical protein